MRAVPVPELERFAREVLAGAGATEDVAAQVAAHLVRADASGRGSHGVRSLTGYLGAGIDGGAEVKVVSDRGSVVVIDGGGGFGPVTGNRAVAIAVERASVHGICAVAGRNAGHLGRLGDYAEQLAGHGVASILLVNAQGGHQTIAPWGGTDARLANNPVALGFPGERSPVVTDFALSVAAARRVHSAHERGEPLPGGWIEDADGSPSTDPLDYMERGGRLLPLGGAEAGHKGYGLIVLVDLLVAALAGGGLPGAPGVPTNGFLLIAIDAAARPAGLVEAFRDHVAAGSGEVRLPGEQSAAARQRAEREGVTLDDATWAALEGLSARTGVPLP